MRKYATKNNTKIGGVNTDKNGERKFNNNG